MAESEPLTLGPYPHPPRLESIDLPPHDPPHLPLLRNGISALTSINASLMDNIWQVPQTVETLIATVTESAVRLAQQISQLDDEIKDGEEDDPEFREEVDKAIEECDGRIRELIDVRVFLEHVRLEVARVKQNATKEGALGPYEAFEEGLEEFSRQYKKKSKREKYGNTEEYRGFKQSVYQAMGKPVPPERTWFPEEVTANDESEDEVEVAAEVISYKCPLTLMYFENPVRNKACKHSYEKDAIMQQIRSYRDPKTNRRADKIPCPVPGCSKMVSAETLKEDRPLQLMARDEKRKEEERRLQAQLQDDTIMDEDDEIDEEDAGRRSTQIKKEKGAGGRRQVTLDDDDD